MSLMADAATENRVVSISLREKTARTLLSGMAMHALICRATVSDEVRNPLSIAAEAVRHADALIEVLKQRKD